MTNCIIAVERDNIYSFVNNAEKVKYFITIIAQDWCKIGIIQQSTNTLSFSKGNCNVKKKYTGNKT